MSLQTLDPAIAVKRGEISFIAVAAGRVDAGTMATVQVVNGTLKDEDTFLLSSGDVRALYSARFALKAYMSTENADAALMAVLQKVEVVLQDEPWGPPIDLHALPTLPTFPTEVFPEWLGNFVRELAEFSQTPVDLGAMIGLAVLSTACQRLADFEVQPGHIEPLCSYILVAMHSGERKSAIYKALAQPIYDFEAAIADRDARDIGRRYAERRVLEKAIERAIQDAAKKDALPEDKDRVNELTAKLQDLPEVAERVLVLQDSTPEALILEMSRQHGCIAALDAEGGLLDTMTGRYSDSGPNLDPLLKAHAGDEIRSARVARGRITIKNPCLTMGIAPQPDVLRKLADKDGAKSRGLLARFLYSLPTTLKGRRKVVTTPVADATTRAYKAHVARILGAGEPPEFDAIPVRFRMTSSRAAYQRWIEFSAWIEPFLAPDAVLGGTDGWAEKLAGQVARHAAMFHIADGRHPHDQVRLPVSEDAMNRAIRVATEYLIPHALGALRFMGVDPVVNEAHALLEWALRTERPVFRYRDAHNDMEKRFATKEKFLKAADYLQSLDCIRPVDHGSRPKGGRPRSPEYVVNPGYRQNLQNRQNPVSSEEFSEKGGPSKPRHNRQNPTYPPYTGGFDGFDPVLTVAGEDAPPEENHSFDGSEGFDGQDWVF